jgi:predicted permease
VAVLSYGYWTQHFGGDPAVLNELIEVNGTPFTVVGVAQPGFGGVEVGVEPNVYVPITMISQFAVSWLKLDSPSAYFLGVIGRLKPGITRESAEVGLQPLFHAILKSELPVHLAQGTVTRGVAQTHFLAGTIKLARAEHGRPVIQQSAQEPLLFLIGMFGIILFLGCANVAGLLLARGEARNHEMAVRLALGASRLRLIRQLLTESLLLAFAGGAVGLLVASWTLDSMIPAVEKAWSLSGFTANLDPRVLAFAAVATILSGIAFGLLPAVRTSRINLQAQLKDQGVTNSGGADSAGLRKVLIFAQVAMTTMLLVAAVLFGDSLVRLERTGLGMNIAHIVQFSIDPGLSKYSPARTIQLFDTLREDIRALPGVISVTAAEDSVLAGANDTGTMTFEGYKGNDTNVEVNFVGPQFFSTFGIPLGAGREFQDDDSTSSPKVCIINEKLAQRYFAGTNPIGKHLVGGWGPTAHPDINIVGIVSNAKDISPSTDLQPTVYFPYEQNTSITGSTLYVRTSVPPLSMSKTLRQIVGREAPNVPIYDVETVAEQLKDQMFGNRAITFLTISAGLLAALLAAVGLYGVMAYIVVRRTREIGIRLAMGALPRDIVRMTLRQAGLLAASGLAIGLAGAFAAARLIASMLYGVKATDPVAFALSAVLLALIAFVASYLPARRAMRVNPIEALRHE